jgi:hypothetical protein
MDDIIYYQGQTYTLKNWLSLEDYSKKYNISLPDLHLHIKQGKISPANLLVIERWDLLLISDKPL